MKRKYICLSQEPETLKWQMLIILLYNSFSTHLRNWV